ncbi:penicillin acylase family protein [Solimonas sp. K1W22B-7]|uniref:penicillin acylase family protein n=1 Tax=Solimonas sp. K1W22B-7 TaxID=2303331 RepID=UPI000E3373AE|nr:penicillin acylase family protein [Solimonas sp. K1W22B-7]AXQ30343.1 penicillin acylase family protein [Solimonas sp. K1W22B-7]
MSIMRTAGHALALTAILVLAACGGRSDPVPGSSGNGSGSNGGGNHAPGGNEADSILLNAMPPGSNGNSAGGLGLPVGGAQFVYPRNFRDGLDLYAHLAYARQGLKAEPCTPPANIDEHEEKSDLACNYFKHEGLTPDSVVSTTTLTALNGKTVTIKRDGWGVPFVEGEDRLAAMYGFGYAGAQDRLWLYDVLRYVGRGRFSEYLGPAPDTFGFDTDIANVAGYSEAELTQMIEATAAKFGTVSSLVLRDLDAQVAGMNAYIEFLRTPGAIGQVPPEYAALSIQPGNELLKFPPQPFRREDIVASAILIQSIFASGGGSEHVALQLLQRLDPSFGPASGAIPKVACEFWRDVRHANDPDTPRSIDTAYATQSPPRVSETCPQALPPGTAVWDAGSFQPRATLASGNSGGLPLPLPTPATVLNLLDIGDLLPSLSPVFSLTPIPGAVGQVDEVRPPFRHRSAPAHTYYASLEPSAGAHAALGRAGFAMPMRLSNYIAVTGAQSKSGHPIGIMGPQASYFVPQLLWEVAVKSNGGTAQDFAGRGAVFGNLPYINLGRGRDFSFSATSGESDLVDVRVSKLCKLDGTPASRDDSNGDGFPDADGYVVDAGDGQGMRCRALFRRTDSWTAHPTVASIALGGPTGPQDVRRYVLRTHYGPVFATALINGEPVAISRQRSTFFAELDTAAPFALVTTPTVKSAQDFQRLFNSMTGTFNWIYVDRDDVGYIHSGLYPQRAAGVHPELPSWGNGLYEWAVDAPEIKGNFFANFGGTRAFPSRTKPVAQGDPLRGYFEWPGYLPLSAHPQAINPEKGYTMSWNNSPARDWWAADFNGTFGPTHRVDMLAKRLQAFKASGRKHDIASMIEVMADAAFTDLRGQEMLPLLLELMKKGTLSADQQQAAELMQQWIDAGSQTWIDGKPGFGSYRRDRDHDGSYDMRAQVLLMDAWYPRLIDSMLPQLVAQEGYIGQGRYDNPRAQGSAYQEGWFQHMRRTLQMALGETRTPYRQLKCADGSQAGCRSAVLTALDQALADLGGLAAKEQWEGSPLAPAGDQRVEDADAVKHTAFSFLPVPPIHWTNRPTFQQAVEYHHRDE